MTHHHTVPLRNGGWIETSAKVAGRRLRLTARLAAADGIIEEVLRRDYSANDPNAAVDAFTGEWAKLTRVSPGQPLFGPIVGRGLGEILAAESACDEAWRDIERHKLSWWLLGV